MLPNCTLQEESDEIPRVLGMTPLGMARLGKTPLDAAFRGAD